MKPDLPIGLAEEFRQAVELGLCEEVARLDFDIHLFGTCEASPTTETSDLVTSFVFVEVENELVGVWRHTSVGGTQGAYAFAVAVAAVLHGGITVVVFVRGGIAVVVLLQEERRCV